MGNEAMLVTRLALRVAPLESLHGVQQSIQHFKHPIFHPRRRPVGAHVSSRRMCYDLNSPNEEVSDDANVQTSASGRPQSRMVRKMIREIFGHPMAPTDCTVYLATGRQSESRPILAVFHPCGSDVDILSLGMGPHVREATQEEQSSISFWYTARVRIDHRVAAYTEMLAGNTDSEHVKFGTFATVAEAPPGVSLSRLTEACSGEVKQKSKAKLRLNTMYRRSPGKQL